MIRRGEFNNFPQRGAEPQIAPVGNGFTRELPAWPGRLQELAVQDQGSAAQPSGARDEMWLLVHMAVFYYLRSHSRRLGGFLEEDLHDLATEKSLDLLHRIRTGKWNLEGLEPLMIVAYFSKVARNCLIDQQRKYKSEQSMLVDAWRFNTQEAHRRPAPTPLDRLQHKEFAEQLRRCAETLEPRSRLIWLLRVFGGRSTEQIAGNSRVNLQAGHVNVLLHRARGQIRTCMTTKGFDTSTIPAGCFAEMLRSFDLKRRLPELEADDA